MEKEISKRRKLTRAESNMTELFDTMSDILHKKSVIALGTAAIVGAAFLGLSADHNKGNKDPFHGQKYEETEQQKAERGSVMTASYGPGASSVETPEK